MMEDLKRFEVDRWVILEYSEDGVLIIDNPYLEVVVYFIGKTGILLFPPPGGGDKLLQGAGARGGGRGYSTTTVLHSAAYKASIHHTGKAERVDKLADNIVKQATDIQEVFTWGLDGNLVKIFDANATEPEKAVETAKAVKPESFEKILTKENLAKCTHWSVLDPKKLVTVFNKEGQCVVCVSINLATISTSENAINFNDEKLEKKFIGYNKEGKGIWLSPTVGHYLIPVKLLIEEGGITFDPAKEEDLELYQKVIEVANNSNMYYIIYYPNEHGVITGYIGNSVSSEEMFSKIENHGTLNNRVMVWAVEGAKLEDKLNANPLTTKEWFDKNYFNKNIVYKANRDLEETGRTVLNKDAEVKEDTAKSTSYKTIKDVMAEILKPAPTDGLNNSGGHYGSEDI